MAAPPRFLPNVYPTYPDDERVKTVSLRAAGASYSGIGDRHVLIQWSNSTSDADPEPTQILQLSGGVGSYSFFHPYAEMHSSAVTESNTFYVLGDYTREQRDKIIALATAIKYDRRSRVNSCRTWTRDLLEAMVQEGMLTRQVFERIDEDVPLRRRVPEVAPQ